MNHFYALLLLAGVCLPATAQSADEADSLAMHHHEHGELFHRHMMISDIVVTGITGETKLRNSPVPVSLLTRKQLQATASTNIIDAIAREPGVAQITTGSGISKPVIRGLGYNRIVTVNDGIRQEGQQWGDEHGIEIDAQGVNQVQVLKGPASLMYGSDALAGVLILNSEPTMPEGTMRASATTEYQTNNGLFDYSLALGGNKSGFVWAMRYSQKLAHAYKNRYDGYVLGSQFREQALSGLLGLNRRWGHSHLRLSWFNLQPGIVEGERDEQGRFVVPSEEEEEGECEAIAATNRQLKTYDMALPFQKVNHYKATLDNSFRLGDGNLKAIVAYQRNRREEFEESADEPGLNFLLHTVNYNLLYALPLDHWKLNAGVNGMWQHSVNEGEEFLIPDYTLFDIGAFVTGSLRLGRWNLSSGVRLDNRSIDSDALGTRFQAVNRSFTGFTGSVGAVCDLRHNLHLRLNAARGFRTPNLSELCSNGEHEGTLRYEIGNSQLKSEYSTQLDAGLDFSSDYVHAQASAFVNWINHFIFSHRIEAADAHALPDVTVEETDDDYFRYTQGDARLWGFELSLDVHPIERLHFLNAFSYVNAMLLDQPADRKYLPLTPAPRWTSELSYDLILHGRTLNNTFVKVGIEQNLKQNHFFSAYDTETATPAYTLLSAQLGSDILGRNGKTVASVYLIADNLTDCAYQNHLSRLKYADVNPLTHRRGVYNMGRNFTLKVVIPLEFNI